MKARAKWMGGAFFYLLAIVGFVADVRFDFGGVGLFAGWIFIMGVGLMIALVRRHRRLVRYFVTALCITLLGAVGGHVLAKWQRNAAVSKAAPLLSALHKFSADNNAYPSSLEELVPSYIPEVPRPWTGFRKNT